ncbi:MAG: copper chaperone PCu(A)C, partial [Pseudomonadota bacterium]|nr:copper chaperone PCu(A)C [Pseudomonadota bacterium]
DGFKVGGLIITPPWARASAGEAKIGAVYFTVVNNSDKLDRLGMVGTNRGGKVALHNHAMKLGVMKMETAGPVEIRPGSRVEFKPGGLHIMLSGLQSPLRKGELFKLRLIFENTGEVSVDVKVMSVGAKSADEGHN